MKKGLVISFVLLAFFLLWQFPAQAARVKNTTISSVSPTEHVAGSFVVTLTGNNFIGVKAVTPISATTRTAATNVPFVVNSIGEITATVALAADTYYFRVSTKSGTATSPNLVVTPVLISSAPDPATEPTTTTTTTTTPTTEPTTTTTTEPTTTTTTEPTTTTTTESTPMSATEPTPTPTPSPTPSPTPTPTPAPTSPPISTTSYQLTSPVPPIVNAGVVSQGVGTAGGRIMWKDGSNVLHMLACFGGDSHDNWYGHYANLSSGINALVTGGIGNVWSAAYHPLQNKLYIGTNYEPCSLTEFNPTTRTASILNNNLTSVFTTIIGDDNLVYLMCLGNICYSYDPTQGYPAGWKCYGVVDSGAQVNSSYVAIGADAGHVYCGVRYTDGHWNLVISPTSGSPNFSSWEFSGAGDKHLIICKDPIGRWICRRTLADNSYKYYSLHDGTYTEVGPANNAGLGAAPTYCVLASTEFDYRQFITAYNEEVDFTDLFPIKSIHEYSTFKYRVSGGSWSETSVNFTGPLTAQFIHELVPRPGLISPFCLSSGYNAAISLDYINATPTYIGSQIVGSYAAIQHSSGDIYISGYPDQVLRYDPVFPWTLTSANKTPVAPGDGDAWINRPNPYCIKLTAPQLHYRSCLDYDANGLVWNGGNTTRNQGGTSSFDIGNVMWYNPSDGSTGYIFPDWANSPGVKFGNLCAATNRSRICVSDNAGNIWIVDAATKTVDPTPIVPVASTTGRTYMVEVANDVVLGIYINSSVPVYKLIRFKPSTKQILTTQDLGVSGIPFGWQDTEENRKNYKLELGPDGYVWMFVGNSLYRIDPDTGVFSKIIDTNYAKLKFASNNVDLLLYNINTTKDFKYIPGIMQAVSR